MNNHEFAAGLYSWYFFDKILLENYDSEMYNFIRKVLSQ